MRKEKKRMRGALNVLLSLVLAAGLLPIMPAKAAADEPAADLGSVHVTVENTTCPAPDAAWTGKLVDANVALSADSTMMSCVKAAIEGAGKTQVGADSGYISEIDGLAEHDGDDHDPEGKGYSGWMGTLNDWFTNKGFASYSVANGKLSAGDEIRVMYTCTMYDLGNPNNTDRALAGIAFSAGALDKDFSSGQHAYTLTVPEGTTSVAVTPTAANKSYQVRTFVGDTPYRRTADVPVSDGATITVKSGYEDMDAANDAADAVAYTFTVKAESEPPTPEDAVVESGTAYNANWTVYANGVLKLSKIEGTDGKTQDKKILPQSPYLKKYGKTITSIVIDEGITYLGNYLLYGLNAATSISLPSTLTASGGLAFTGCKKLVDYDCAEGCCISVVDDTFVLSDYGATLLSVPDKSKLVGEVTIPSTVTSIGNNLSGATAMTSVVLPAGLTRIGVNAFKGCTGLTEITLPCNLDSSSNAFDGCTSLTSIAFDEGVTIVVGGGLGKLNNLTTMKFPSTLTELNVDLIGESVTDIEFAPGCAYSLNNGVIAKTTESGTELLKLLAGASIVDGDGVLDIPEGVVSIGAKVFEGRSDIKSVVFPSTLKTIGDQAFRKCSNIIGDLSIPQGVTELGQGAFIGTGITKAVIPTGVAAVGSQAFSFCPNLKEIVVGSINDMSIVDHSPNLEAFTVSEGVKAITGRSLVATSCDKLTTINLPASLETLEASALAGNKSLTTINCAEGGSFTFANSVLANASTNTVMYALPSLSGNVTIPEGTKAIGSEVFKDNASITSVLLPEGLVSIGRQAFQGCKGLAGELVIPSTVTSIGQQAFAVCDGLSALNCLDPAVAAEIVYGNKAFSNCTGLTEVHLPQGLSIYDALLTACPAVTAVDLPATVKSLGQEGHNFTGMTNLRSVTMPGVTQLGSREFLNCPNLESVDMPSMVTISQGAFDSYASTKVDMKQLYLPKSLTAFGSSDFIYPTIIYYAGSRDDWNGIAFGNDVLSNIEKSGTVVVYNYKASDEPVSITAQPKNISAFIGLASDETSFGIDVPEGCSAYYFWYNESGNCVKADTAATFSISLPEPGTFNYYCVAKLVFPDGTVRSVKSDDFTLTVSDMDAMFEGSGTEEAPYLLKSAQDLSTLSYLVGNGVSCENEFFKMADDIELPAGWTPIGVKTNTARNAFKGTFDGAGHLLTVPVGEKPLFAEVVGATIKNLDIYGERINGFGLIDDWNGVGLNGVGVTIDNVTLKSGTSTLKSGLLGGVMSGNVFAAVSAGFVANISNCTVEEGVTIGYDGTQSMIGSFAGRFQGTIENCVSYGTVKGVDYVGGIIGTRDNALGTSSVKNCTFNGSVEATGEQAGGIVGGGYENSSAPNGARPSIAGCTASGSVSGNKYVGGILGGDLYVVQTWGNVAGSISNNVFTGTVSGNEYVGAVIGYLNSLNACDVVAGNLYSHGCGADKGISYIKFIDTNCKTHETESGAIYVDSSTGIPGYPGFSEANFNRTDDPMGADADKLCKMQTYFEVSTAVAADGAGAVPATVKVGDTVTVDVFVSANDGAAALFGMLDYDPAVFELVGVSKGAGLSEGASFLPAEGAAEAAFSFYGNEAAADAEGGIVVATVTLKVLAAADAATIGVKDATAAIAGDSLDYAATVSSVATIDVLADALLGDVNGNSRVNIVDAQVVYDMAAGAYGADYAALALPAGWTRATLLWAANVNGDDAIDAVDAFAIQRFVHYGAWA